MAKNSLKTPILGFKVVQASKSVSICNRFHARWANSGKITISKGGGVPLFDAIVRGEPPRPAAPNYLIRN